MASLPVPSLSDAQQQFLAGLWLLVRGCLAVLATTFGLISFESAILPILAVTSVAGGLLLLISTLAGL